MPRRCSCRRYAVLAADRRRAATTTRAWQALSPALHAPQVALRDFTARPVIVFHPAGALAVAAEDRAAEPAARPRRRPASRGRQPLRDQPRSASAGRSPTTTSVREQFAPAQFLDMSDAEKLSRQSFERFDAGVEAQSGGDAPQSRFRAQDRSSIYEVIYLAQAARGCLHARRGSCFDALLRGSAAAKSPLGKERLIPTGLGTAQVALAGRLRGADDQGPAARTVATRCSERGRGGRGDDGACRRRSGAQGKLQVVSDFEVAAMTIGAMPSCPGCGAASPTRSTTPAATTSRATVGGRAHGERRRRDRRSDLQAFELIGPGDVLGINPQEIIRTEPRGWVTDFEPNFLAFVEFYDEDFPWRYTPAAREAATHRLTPWLTLLVLKESEFDRDRTPGRPLSSVSIKAAQRRRADPASRSALGLGTCADRGDRWATAPHPTRPARRMLQAQPGSWRVAADLAAPARAQYRLLRLPRADLRGRPQGRTRRRVRRPRPPAASRSPGRPARVPGLLRMVLPHRRRGDFEELAAPKAAAIDPASASATSISPPRASACPMSSRRWPTITHQGVVGLEGALKAPDDAAEAARSGAPFPQTSRRSSTPRRCAARRGERSGGRAAALWRLARAGRPGRPGAGDDELGRTG